MQKAALVLLLLSTGALLGLSVAATAQSSHPEVRAIRALMQEYSDAIAAGDAERAMALWASDATYYPPNSTPIYGWDAIAARARPYLASYETRHEITSEGTEIRDDFAVDRGTWVQTATPRSGGAPKIIQAKYVRVFRKQSDGTWKLWLDIWNSTESPNQ